VALGTRNRRPGEITVGEVATGDSYICHEEDNIHDALQEMARHRVRRLPVVNNEGVLTGILSMDDVVLHTDGGLWARSAELSDEDVVKTLRQIYGPRLPQVVHTRAAVN